ncbi:copper transporter [Bailinhaonella thermotolerans]|uniref:Copper transporter n=1 Tax=Bailinhaonella thermotolerans TaxID=1070861 RepID=A0A3A4A273_9ACTN|nr:copper transporter [Bailinhaonella thermotolerans]RJL20676.1 copper transporter [Bailinhaonella thermotolerans]
MIDFRYHLVSIVAIFLALTIGIVLGNTALQEPVVQGLKGTTEQLRKTNDALRAEKADLERRGNGAARFIEASEKQLVSGLLAGERVVIVETPGAPGAAREPISRLITEAGATISGRVAIQDKFLDPRQAGFIEGLVGQTKPPAVQIPPNATTYAKAAAVLGDALMTPDTAQINREYREGGAVLDTFREAGLLTYDEDPSRRATLAVVIAPQKPYEGEAAAGQTAALVSLAEGLDAAGRGALVGGVPDAAAGGGLIAALRSGEAESRVSSQDAIDTAFGRVVVVQALAEQLAGKTGQYGIGEDATAPLPSPVPSPPAPATPAPTR